MELKQFVYESISQIMGGVKKAHVEHAKKNSGALLTPRIVTNDDGSQINPEIHDDMGSHSVEKIEFDITLSVSEEKSKNGEIGVTVLPVKLSFGRASMRAQSNSHRVRFSVPVIWSTDPLNSEEE